MVTRCIFPVYHLRQSSPAAAVAGDTVTVNDDVGLFHRQKTLLKKRKMLRLPLHLSRWRIMRSRLRRRQNRVRCHSCVAVDDMQRVEGFGAPVWICQIQRQKKKRRDDICCVCVREMTRSKNRSRPGKSVCQLSLLEVRSCLVIPLVFFVQESPAPALQKLKTTAHQVQGNVDQPAKKFEAHRLMADKSLSIQCVGPKKQSEVFSPNPSA